MASMQHKASEFRLQIRLFGAFDVRVEDVPIPPLRSRKVQWLLALLVLRQGQSLDRAWLAATLWPESGPEQALYNLRQSLSNLRHALGKAGACLHASMVNALSLEADSAEVDVLAFDAAIAAGSRTALEQAVALYRGPLLEGCAEEWALRERRIREESYLNALEILAEQALGSGESSAAVRHLRSALQVDPLREQTQRLLIRTLADQGAYGAAVQTYRDLRVLLHRELNTEPDPETTALFQQIQAEARRRQESAPAALLSSSDPPGRQLPSLLSPLIGRKAEMEQIVPALHSARLLTLKGPGGVGKTRLALAIAEQVAGDYSDGACFVDLAPLTDPALIPQAVATALQVREEPGLPLLATLQRSLRSKTLLLLLDNCEHLLDACADLANALLQSGPGVRILAASRQSLGLPGEVSWQVPALSTPRLSELPSQSKPAQKDGMSLLRDYDAVQLFVVRAQQALPSFRITPQNAETVARICTHLDGLPLALELAAARVPSLSVEEIHSKLRDRFRLLTRGSRAALPRQKTLRALLDWSYDLLSEDEKTLLCRLAVFVEGWTLPAAERVCAEESEEHPERTETFEAWEVLDLLTSLVDKSLVTVKQEAGLTRYRLLETVRQYAQDRLQERGEAERVRQRHQAFFVALAEEAEPQLQGPQQTDWLQRLEQDHANLRQAVFTAGSPEAALRIAGALWRYLHIRNYFSEGREWLARALAGGDGAERAALRAKALHGAGVLALAQSDYVASYALQQESLALSRALGDPDGIANALQSLGNVVSEQGDYTTAQTWYSESLALRRQLGDTHGIATLLNNLGNIASSLEDTEAARALHEESLQLRRAQGNKSGIASSLYNLGIVAQDLDDYATARALQTESLMLQRELGNIRGIANALHSLGSLAYNQEDYPTSRLFYRESLSLFHEIGNKRGLAYTLQVLGGLALHDGQAKRAVHLLSAAEALRKSMNAHLPLSEQTQHEEMVARAVVALGEEGFALAWSEGDAMSLEQAVEYAQGGPLVGV